MLKHHRVALAVLLLAALSSFSCMAKSKTENPKESAPPVVENIPPAPPKQAPASPREPTAPALTVDAALDHMETARKNLKCFRARAVKHLNTVPLEDIEVFEGNFQFKMPRLLRLELKSRETGKTRIEFVGKKYAWVYRVDEAQAEGVPLKKMKEKVKSANPLEYGLAEDVHNLKKNYLLKLLPGEKVNKIDTAVLEMTPRGAAPDDEDGKVTLWLSKETWLPIRIREVKNNADVIETYTFDEMKINIEIDDGVFEFKPGDDVDVQIHPVD